MKKNSCISLFLFCLLYCCQPVAAQKNAQHNSIDLAGTWLFRVDSLDEGERHQWFNQVFAEQVVLPGSMATNGKGNDITTHTPWTGEIQDSSYFLQPQYAAYRQPGHIKIPFWLQPVKYYTGAAWYQKKITVPPGWKNKYIELFIERAHWETTVWVDGNRAGSSNSLGTPHVYALTRWLSPGEHTVTIRVDNRVKDFNVGQNSHSISDHTQSNWNGMVGKLCVRARSPLHITSAALFPSVPEKQVLVRLTLKQEGGASGQARVRLAALPLETGAEKPAAVEKNITLQGDSSVVEIRYPMGAHPLLWDEFHPHLYRLQAAVIQGEQQDTLQQLFGMRTFATAGTQFTINGRTTFLRGTLECAIFPRTGYPPTDVAAWMRIFSICRSYGLNHMRFHSWCPPDAAFEAADRSGFYLQVECSSWANQGVTVGDGKGIDQYLYAESERMVKTYGNHPSFCMMAYGNEPAGKHQKSFLTAFMQYWQHKDPRRLYTTAAGWPVVEESDYNSTSDPRIQHWGEGLKSVINIYPPRGDYDWRDTIRKWNHPTVSHEIGQWCVYPDFSEIKKYDGVLKARNFEIFRDRLEQNGMGRLADSFLLASGKLQTLCYKADIEAALRTPGFGGFQLLDLHDFPGQGTALVGVLNPFWEDKGYVNAAGFSRFCNAVVPLARMPKFVYLNNELLEVPVEIVNFGAAPLQAVPAWQLADTAGRVIAEGRLPAATVGIGNGRQLGIIKQSLGNITTAARLQLTVTVGGYRNSWDLFVYPARLPEPEANVLVTQKLDAAALKQLQDGGNVLLTLAAGSVRMGKGAEVKAGFSSIFWNTAWTKGQPPHTLGILCNPLHPALQCFPTQYHSNWQWCDAFTHGNVIRLDAFSVPLTPLVRVIDDWVTARPLALLFECRVGKGRLLVSGIDLLTGAAQRPEARQLLYSLKQYMGSAAFHPQQTVPVEEIRAVYE